MLQCTQGTMLKIAKLHRPEEHPLKRGWNRLIFAKFKVRRLHKKFLGTNALMHPGNNLKKGQAAILSISYITTRIVKTYNKCGKNPQSARRKPNYHTRCGKNCHKILSV